LYILHKSLISFSVKIESEREQTPLNSIPKATYDTNNSVVLNNNSSTGIKYTPKEVQFYTIDNIDIMKVDLGIFSYAGAEDTCLKLKGNWRLPTSEELHLIYTHSDSLGDFKTKYYLGAGFDPEENLKIVYRLDIMNGDIEFLQSNEEINSIYGFRPVRNHQ
jgi:hypothetical protein